MKRFLTHFTSLAAFVLLAFTATTAQAVTLNSTNFPDNNFRAALAEITGVAEGGTFDATAITSLNVTGKGITNLTGIANFTELTELNISDNNITEIDLRSNTALKTLEMRNNTVIRGFAAPSNKMYLPSGLKKLDAEGCTAFKYVAGITTYCTGLEWLSFKNCNITAYSTGVTAQKGLKYLDYSGNNVGSWNTNIATLTDLTYLDYSGNLTTTPTSINVSALKKLEYLNLSNNGKLQYANVSGLSELREFNMSGNDMYWGTQTNTTNKLTPANCPKLEVLILDNANILTAPTVDGFQNLKTLSVGGSKNTFTSGTILTLNNCPAIETVNVSGAANITSVAIKNSGLTSIPTITSDGCTKLKTLVLDGNLFSDVPAVSAPFTCLSLQNNQFPATYAIDGNTQYEGLDLGNNGFTSLTVENSAMSALSLASNASLTELHLHGNDNLTKTASATGISAAQGLYIQGLSTLKVLDIENSSFEELGQSNSTDGCTGIETLKAAHNKFTTFSNAYNNLGTSGYNGYRPASLTRSSLEKLTGLKYLDLSYNNLQDSLHLYRNTALETLIAHHNRTIDRYDNMEEYLANSKVTNNGSSAAKPHNKTTRGKKFFTKDDIGAYNDTIGLRMLNLKYNKQLKYIDISYTNIMFTAADGRIKNFPVDYYMANFYTPQNEVYDGRTGHYIFVNGLTKLEEFYSDYNGMKTVGFTPNYVGDIFPNLKRLSQIETRGQDIEIMAGSFNPNGRASMPNVEYLNFAHSDIDSIGVTNLAKVKYLNLSGNWTKNNWAHWRGSATTKGTTLDLTKCNELVECVVDDCPYLEIITASNKTNLSSLSVKQDPSNTQLKQIYVAGTGLKRINNEEYNPTEWPKRIGSSDEDTDYLFEETSGLGLAGIGSAANLELLYCEDNSNLTSLDVTANSNLKYLHAYNNAYGADGLNLSQNNNIVTAWVSNSGLTSLKLNGATALDTLKCYDNAALAALDVRASSNMRYLDLARCHVADLDLSSNSALVHFDCSNNVKCDDEQGNWLSDLNFASTALQTVVANNNNLYNITLPASLPSLTRMEFAHNHINGIDLSGATSLAREAIVDEDNGRAITAEVAKNIYKNPVEILYYFQLKENAGDAANEGYNTFVGSKISMDELKPESTRHLSDDGFDATQVNGWSDGVKEVVDGTRTQKIKALATPDDDHASHFFGKAVILEPESINGTNASGHAEYTYNNGRSNSTFYLDWKANAEIVTAIDDVTIEAQPVGTVYYNLAGQPSDTPHQGVNIVVTKNTDGSTTTTKVIK